MDARVLKRPKNEESTPLQHVTFQYDGDRLDINPFIAISSEEASGLRQGQHAITSMKGAFCTGTHYVYLIMRQKNSPVFVQNVISKYCASTGKRIQLEGEILLIKPPQPNEVSLVISANISKPDYWTWDSSFNTVAPINLQQPLSTQQPATTPTQVEPPNRIIVSEVSPLPITRSVTITVDTAIPNAPRPLMEDKETQSVAFVGKFRREGTTEKTMPLRHFTLDKQSMELLKSSYRMMCDQAYNAEAALEAARVFERERCEANFVSDAIVHDVTVKRLEKELEAARNEITQWRKDAAAEFLREMQLKNSDLFRSLNLVEGKVYTSEQYRDLAMRMTIFFKPTEVMQFLSSENVKLKAILANKREAYDAAARVHIENLEARNAELESHLANWSEVQKQAKDSHDRVRVLEEELQKAETVSDQRRIIMEQHQANSVPEIESLKHELQQCKTFLDGFRNPEKLERDKIDGMIYNNVVTASCTTKYFHPMLVHPLTELGRSYQCYLNESSESIIVRKCREIYEANQMISELKASNTTMGAQLLDANIAIKSRNDTIEMYNVSRMRNGWSAPDPTLLSRAAIEASTIHRDIADLHALTKAARMELDTGFRHVVELRDIHIKLNNAVSSIRNERTKYASGNNNEALYSLDLILAKLQPKPLIPEKKRK